jgi:hypothetical protein
MPGDSTREGGEEPPRVPDMHKGKSWADIDTVFNSSGPRSEKKMNSSHSSQSSISSRSTTELEKYPKLKEVKELKTRSISGPFAQFRCNRKKRRLCKQMCRCAPPPPPLDPVTNALHCAYGASTASLSR